MCFMLLKCWFSKGQNVVLCLSQSVMRVGNGICEYYFIKIVFFLLKKVLQ